MAAELTQLDLPPTYHIADQASLRGQRIFIRNIRIQLSLLLVAGVASTVSWRAGNLDVAALIAGIAFVIAASLRLNSLSTSPHRQWYEGRAAAESIKTLAWRFAMGGFPFAVADGDEQAETLFSSQVQEITSDLQSLSLSHRQEEITESMKRSRGLDLSSRKRTYLEGRIRDQERWYAAKSRWNEERAKLWSRTTLAAESVGALGAFLVGFGVIGFDIFGLAGAAAAVAAAWLETKQHHTLANAYRVAASELRSISTILEEEMDEQEWAERVSDSEEAISREHTLWRARVTKT